MGRINQNKNGNIALTVILLTIQDNMIHHTVLAAAKSNNEAYTFPKMLKENDAGKFIKAMKKET